MYRITRLILGLCLLFLAGSSMAQQDSLKQKDSLNAALLSDYGKTLEKAEQQRVQDSIMKAELETRLNSLATTDNLKKEELQKQLQELNAKEGRRIAEKKARIDSLRATAKSFPVMGMFNDTLFVIYSKLGSLSAKDRAAAISERIGKLARDFTFSGDSLRTVDAETAVDLVFGETIIMGVSENDALWNNTSKEELADNYKQIIVAAVADYKSKTSFATLAKEIGLALLVLAILGAALYYTGKFFKWTGTKISAQKDKRLTGLKIRNYTLFDSQRQVDFMLSLNTLLKWVLFLVLVYIALPILFGIFPWTKNLAQTLFGYVLNPVKKMALGLWAYLPNLITITVIFMVFRYVIKGIRFLKLDIERGNLKMPGFYPDWANPTYQILRVLMYAFMFVIIFPYLPGSDSPVFQGVSVFLGFLFTFGSAGSLSNIIAGVVLTYMRLFRIGDRVKIGEVFGDVVEKSLLVTRVKTIKNEIISIPNSTVMSSHTINYSNETVNQGLILHTTVTIGYDVPWKDMYQALLTAADRTNHLLKDPKPFVLQTSLDDFYVSYQINAYTKEANKQATIYSDLHQNIQDCCNEMGIEILSPHYRAARDGNMTTIPTGYLGKDYKMPGFNIKIDKNDK